MKPKYQIIKNALIADIKGGVYKVGMQLPSCRELASKWNVSFITVSNAINELAAKQYIDVIHGKGAFVRWRPQGDFLEVKNVKIFLPFSSHPYIEFFKNTTSKLLEKFEWQYEFVIISKVEDLIEQVKNCSHYSMVYAFGLSKYEHIRDLCNAGLDRLIMVNERYERFNISSSAVDNSQAIRLAMDEFKKCNRNKVVLFCSNLNHIEEVSEFAVWQNLLRLNNPEIEDINHYLWDTKLNPFTDFQKVILDFLLEKFNNNGFDNIDAIITTDDEKAVLFNSFCHEHKINIPKDISLITLNDSNMAKFTYPKISAVNINLEKQIENAIQILNEKSSGFFNGFNLRLAEPELIIRESTAKK